MPDGMPISTQFFWRFARTVASDKPAMTVALQGSTKPLAKVWVGGRKFSLRVGTRIALPRVARKVRSSIGRHTRLKL